VIEAEPLAIDNAEREAGSNEQCGELSDSDSHETLILINE
jgi:hypothetical protein